MKPEQLLEILGVANNLKLNTRHCYTQLDRKESVADHSWRIALMAMLLDGVEEYRDYDMNKVIRMCLIHDLGEAFTGDIPAFLKKDSDEGKEEDILTEWFSSFPEPQRSQWLELLAEMSRLESKEAKLYKSLDRMEALISHNESDISTWLPLEYDLQLTYGKEQMQFSPYMMELRKTVDDWTVRKIEESKKAVE